MVPIKNQFQEDSPIKNSRLFNSFRYKLEARITREVSDFENKNSAKRINYIVCMNLICESFAKNHTFVQILCMNWYLQEKANLHNEQLCSELENMLVSEILKQINDLSVVLIEENINSSFGILEKKAVHQVCCCHMYQSIHLFFSNFVMTTISNIF